MSDGVVMQSAEQAVPQGYKQTEVGTIPEDWLVAQLDSYTSFISYGFTNPMPTVNDGPVMITARDINHGRILFDSARHTTYEAYCQYLTPKSKPKINDLLLTKDGTLGRLALVGQEGICINQSVALLRPNNMIDPLFFKLLLESPYYQEKMLDDAGGSTIKHIYITIVNKMLLGVPKSKKEQTAIANALSDVDALLVELEKLIAKKQAIKTATMQQLLTGKTRLPQFATYTDGERKGQPKGMKSSELGEIPEDWEVVSLGDYSVYLGSGKTNTKMKGEYPLYGSTGLIGSCKNPEYKGETILIARVGANAGRLNVVNGEYGVSDNTIIIKLNSNADLQFFRYWLVRKNLNTLVFGSGQPLITGTQLKELLLSIPKKEEQVAISTILSDMDAEIQALEKRLDKTRQIKQGMMQELLTGRTRLPFDAEGNQ